MKKRFNLGKVLVESKKAMEIQARIAEAKKMLEKGVVPLTQKQQKIESMQAYYRRLLVEEIPLSRSRGTRSLIRQTQHNRW